MDDLKADRHAENERPQRCYVHTFVTIDKCGCPPDPTLTKPDRSADTDRPWWRRGADALTFPHLQRPDFCGPIACPRCGGVFDVDNYDVHRHGALFDGEVDR